MHHIWNLMQISLSLSQDAAATAAIVQSFKFSSLMLRNCLTGTLLERFIMLIYLTEKTLCNFFLQKKNHYIRVTETIGRLWVYLLAACFLEGEVQARTTMCGNTGPVLTPSDSPINQSNSCWFINII